MSLKRSIWWIVLEKDLYDELFWKVNVIQTNTSDSVKKAELNKNLRILKRKIYIYIYIYTHTHTYIYIHI